MNRVVSDRQVRWQLAPWRILLATAMLLFGAAGFLFPALTTVVALFDPALNGPGIPKLARQLHESLTRVIRVGRQGV